MDNEIKEFFDSLKIGEIIHFGSTRSENAYVIINKIKRDRYYMIQVTNKVFSDGNLNICDYSLYDIYVCQNIKITGVNILEMENNVTYKGIDVFSDWSFIKYDDTLYVTNSSGSRKSYNKLGKLHICDMGEHLCYENNCYICDQTLIKKYDYKDYQLDFTKARRFRKDEEELFIGFEIEFEIDDPSEPRSSIARDVKKNFSDIIAECKNDGSLSYGFECVSHPIHLARINTVWFKNRMSALFATLKAHKCTMASTCGLHFHISNAGLGNLENTQANLFYVTNGYQELFKELSGRYELPVINNSRYSDDDDDEDEECVRDLFSYCEFQTNVYRRGVDPVQFYKDKLSTLGSHYNAVNISPKNTTEIRFFGGTLDIDRFMMDINIIIALIRLCKKDNIRGTDFNYFMSFMNETYKSMVVNILKHYDFTTKLPVMVELDIETIKAIATETINECKKYIKEFSNLCIDQPYTMRDWFDNTRDPLAFGVQLITASDLLTKDTVNVNLVYNRLCDVLNGFKNVKRLITSKGAHVYSPTNILQTGLESIENKGVIVPIIDTLITHTERLMSCV